MEVWQQEGKILRARASAYTDSPSTILYLADSGVGVEWICGPQYKHLTHEWPGSYHRCGLITIKDNSLVEVF